MSEIDKIDIIKQEKLKKMCAQYSIDYRYALRYWNNHTELDIQQIINYYLTKEKVTIKELCMQYGLDYQSVKNFKKHNITRLGKTISNVELIKLYMSDKPKAFKQKCIDDGISYTSAIKIKNNRPDLTEEQIIKYCLQHKRVKTRDLCKLHNVSYYSYIRLKRNRPESSFNEVIQELLNKQLSFRDKCRKYNVDIVNAESYKASHRWMTDEQVIIYYRLDCYINILGEIVEVQHG